jgi:hypothetical protein
VASVGDDRLAERRVCRSQHGRDQRDLKDAQPIEHQYADEVAQQDRQRQPDQQQAPWKPDLLLEDAEIGIGRIDEQD